MKNFLSRGIRLITFIVALICIMPTVVNAQEINEKLEKREILYSGVCGNNLLWELDSNGVLTISGSGEMDNYGLDYDEWFTPWRDYSKEIESVIIENGVTSIGVEAFAGCKELKDIFISGSVTSIGKEAFSRCEKLSNIQVDENSRNYCTDAKGILLNAQKTKIILAPCNLKGNYKIPDTVTDVCSYAFENCIESFELTISKNVKNMEQSAFAWSKGLGKVTILKGVTNIGDYAFIGCENLAEITIPDGMKTIGKSAFNSCKKLTKVVIPDTVIDLGEYTFQWCSGLESIEMSDNLTCIGEYVFDSCTNLADINIPNGVVEIGAFSFYDCLHLKDITIPESVEVIDDCAFAGCKILEEIKIPMNVVNIGQNAFADCENLTGVIMHSGSLIEDQVFANCTNLKEIRFCGNAPVFDCEGEYDNGCFYNVKANCYYPEKNSSWTNEIKKNYGGTITWIGYEGPAYRPTVNSSNLVSNGKIKLEWDKVTGASKYNVYSSTSQNGTYKLIKTTTNTSYTDTSVSGGKKYYYYVEAVDSDGKNAQKSETISCVCDLARPTVTLSSVASSGKIKVSWKKVEGAKSYKVYRSTSENGKYTLLKTVTGTSLTNSNAKAGTKYFYKVMAVAENTNANSAYSVVKSRVCDLARPSVTLSNVTSNGKIKVSWKKVEGAKSYKVYRSTSENGKYTLLKTVTGTSLTNSNAKAGTKYFYKVMAVAGNTNANSAYSTVKSRVCDLARPTVTIKKNNSGKPKLSWKKIEGTTKYQVYRGTKKNGQYSLLKTVTGTSLTDSNAKSGKTYYYKVKAINKNSNANSVFSTIVSMGVK